MAIPADGITLDDKRRTTEQLLRAGADIHALNAVRKHLSAIKGGWLAARCAGACFAYAVSDVVGDDISVIASGPTVADTTTFHDALDVIHRFAPATAYPSAVVAAPQVVHPYADEQNPLVEVPHVVLLGAPEDL